jgi:hypothetical protein
LGSGAVLDICLVDTVQHSKELWYRPSELCSFSFLQSETLKVQAFVYKRTTRTVPLLLTLSSLPVVNISTGSSPGVKRSGRGANLQTTYITCLRMGWGYTRTFTSAPAGIITTNIMKPTWCAFHSIYWEFRACTCFEHYLLILRRWSTNGTWYIGCVCQLAVPRLQWFRALLAHPQDLLHKRHLVYYVHMSVGCATITVTARNM